jgi:signal transduction histidine kinase
MDRRDTQRLVICYVLIVAIVVLDWMTTAGVVVGILLSAPIVLLSLLPRSKPVLFATLIALVGYTIAATFGQPPVSPRSVWVPNRILAVLAILASAGIALNLQRHRLIAEEALRAALSARDTNRLLMSLMAHDLRAPLVAATQVLEYVERSSANGSPVDAQLVGDTGLRLRRNLRVIEQVLELARRDAQQDSASQPARSRVRVADEIEREAMSFLDEAEACGKRIVLRVRPVAGIEIPVDALVVRQVLAILLDNAIRYARPGPISIEAALRADKLVLSVTDSGPGLSARPPNGANQTGSGIGLDLCRTLAARAGGSLDLDLDSEQGTRFTLRLPATGASRRPGDAPVVRGAYRQSPLTTSPAAATVTEHRA